MKPPDVTPERKRLDQTLVDRGLAQSRSRAADMVKRGCVTVDGDQARKHGMMVSASATIWIEDPASQYVSRAALKLVAGLDAANIDVTGKHALDLGASTGGFTQVLLERGAAHVVSIDVGHGQMVDAISGDPRVTNWENLNARHLNEGMLEGFVPDIIVSDMSFVSLTIAAEPALRLAAEQAEAVLLVKPQFEVGREHIGKGGLVTDPDIIQVTNDRICRWFEALPGWQVTNFLQSPVVGGDGNQEFLLCGKRT